MILGYIRFMIEDNNPDNSLATQTNLLKKNGRPPLPDEEMLYALDLLKTNTFREVSMLTGISRSSLARALKRLSAKKKDWK